MWKLRHSFFTVALLATMPSAANADMAVRYQPPASGLPVRMDMTIEVNDDGRIRVQMSPGPVYILIVDNVAYYVQRGPNGDYAIPMAAIVELATEQMAAIGFPDDAVPEESETNFQSLGSVMVEGRTGTAYRFVGQERQIRPDQSMLVISSDPTLAQAGRAIALATRLGSLGTMGNAMLQQMGRMRDNMVRILETGTPLRFGPMVLTDVSSTPIDDSRFALPTTVLSGQEMRRMTAPYDPPPTLPAFQQRQQPAETTPR